MRSTRALTLLLVLLAGGGVGYWVWSGDAPTAGVPAAAARGAGAGGGTGDSVTDIRLELLERERTDLSASERNPFRFERRLSAQAPPRLQSARRAAPPVDLGPTEPPPPPPPPPIPLRFIGYLQPRDTAGRVAVLSDGRGNVFNGKEGDVIEGRYRLLRVGNDSADLIYLDGRGRQTIRLSGQ